MTRTALKGGGLKLLIGAGVAAVVIPVVISTLGQAPEINTFNKGTIDLTAAPDTAVIALAGMMPGDSITNPVVISNEGTETLRYSIKSTATNDDGKGLKEQIVLTVKTVDSTSPTRPCDNFDGRQLYTGDLDATAGRIVGDPGMGQSGVAEAGGYRALASMVSETLCFRVDLPITTGNAHQAATTTASFTFDAEQTTS